MSRSTCTHDVDSTVKCKICTKRENPGGPKYQLIPTNEFWREFIQVYRDNPALWKSDSDEYKDKIQRERSMQKLLDKILQVDSRATMGTVRRKINTLRSNHRRELKKVLKAQESGEPYVPSLWYYKDLIFLHDENHDTKPFDETNKGDTEEFIDEQSRFEPLTNSANEQRETPSPHPGPSTQATKRHRKQSKRSKYRSLIVKSLVENINKTEDDAEVFAKAWAVQFRQLSSDQQIYAKRTIDEIFYRGALGKLNEHNILTRF